ncbi:hypothetical protein [Tissierella praeacuta]|uniref:hypothetical protein n=1 Tax=Tissierella praeacuta TaxID=43131 RepID=UPI001C0FD61B|nr:hypothetical protein [Tissierella praeacuta]MBU5256057.1 hypothetical protein [Tissierella praeacuta]
MKHYDYVEWVLYKNNLLDDEIHEKMEEHLIICDECMEVFLSLIDESDMENAESFIPEDFTEKILYKIENITPIRKPVKKPIRKKMPNDFFLYYVAVASVAIVLTAGGFFSKMIDTVPQLVASTSIEKDKFDTNKIYDFSREITNKTSMFINDFQFRKIKED